MNTILSGDCRDRMKILGDESVQLTCTSPPYYNAKSYSTWPTYEEYLSFLYVTFKEVYRVTEKGRMCCVNLSPVIVPRESRKHESKSCLLYTSPSPRDQRGSRMPSSA